MAAMPMSRILRPQLPPTKVEYVLSFLVPSIHFSRPALGGPVARFSTSPALWKRDNNRNRGLSVLRHTGLRPRQTLSVKKKHDLNLPKPGAIDTQVQGDEDHGLWGFFPDDRRLLMTPAEESQYGKPWTVADLEEHMEAQQQDSDDLHSLWWTCVKERNRLATEKLERARLDAGYGDFENRERDKAVQTTMKAILDLMKKREELAVPLGDGPSPDNLPYSNLSMYEDP